MSGGVSSARMSAGMVFLLQCMCNKLQLMLDDGVIDGGDTVYAVAVEVRSLFLEDGPLFPPSLHLCLQDAVLLGQEALGGRRAIAILGRCIVSGGQRAACLPGEVACMYTCGGRRCGHQGQPLSTKGRPSPHH